MKYYSSTAALPAAHTLRSHLRHLGSDLLERLERLQHLTTQPKAAKINRPSSEINRPSNPYLLHVHGVHAGATSDSLYSARLQVEDLVVAVQLCGGQMSKWMKL